MKQTNICRLSGDIKIETYNLASSAKLYFVSSKHRSLQPKSIKVIQSDTISLNLDRVVVFTNISFSSYTSRYHPQSEGKRSIY